MYELGAELERAISLLRAGRPADAAAALTGAAEVYPGSGELQTLLAQALLQAGREREGAAATDAALERQPQAPWARAMLCRLLLHQKRPAEALSVCLQPPVTADVLAARAEALTALGRPEAALGAFRELLPLLPSSATVRHNMASLHSDLGDFPAAEHEARAALEGGLDAPETWVVLGRALQGQDRYPEAEAAFREAVARRPAFALAQRHLADLVWMMSGDVAAALQALDQAIAANPNNAELTACKARVLEYAGAPQAGYRALAEAADAARDPWLDLAAAQAALAAEPARAIVHAERSFAAGLRTPEALISLAEANLAAGRPQKAAEVARLLLDQEPGHQRGLCLMATAYRLTGDPRYAALADYEAMVRCFALEPPDAWPDLGLFMQALGAELSRLHQLRAHPIGQSVRGGTQSQQNLLASKSPVIRALFQALDGPIRSYLSAGVLPDWGHGGDYRIEGAWSVRLRPGGRHVSHMHPTGRISSACHIQLPAAVRTGRQGWLAFGEPDVPTIPPLGPDHFVEPKVGHVVLFPSYLCHGTVPFHGEETRLAVAFDIVPPVDPAAAAG